MRILAIGDIVGEVGIKYLKNNLKKFVITNNIDFIIANGENAADGMGITEKNFKDLMDLNIDVITMGNHTWSKKDIFKIIDNKKILRPANYCNNVPGKGYDIYTCKNKKICVLNLIGRAEMGILTDNPFVIANNIINEIKKQVDIIIIDFHAEATAEKLALAYYLNGSAQIIFGTHTHVQTADEKILDNGTAYITDIGMTGPKNSIIGMDIEASVKRFVTSLPERYKIANGEPMFNGCIFDIDDENCRPKKITRINE